MAERWAVGSGNWSNVATWDGGVALPTTGDQVHANGFTVTIDQNVTVGWLSTRAGTTPVAGGTFQITSGAWIVTADVYAGSEHCLQISSSGGAKLVGNSYGSNTTSTKYGCSLTHSTAIHQGNSYGGNGSSRHGTNLNPGIHNGDSFGVSTVSNAYGTNIGNGGVQNGNSYGGGVSTSLGTFVGIGGIQNGNSTGGTASGAVGTTINAGGRQLGNSFGGTNATAHGTLNSGIQYGNATGGSAGSGSSINAGGIHVGNGTGGSASGAHGVRVVSVCAYAKVPIATGTTSGAFGVSFSGTGAAGVAVIGSEVGDYPKSLVAGIETTAANFSLFKSGSVPFLI